MLWFALALTYAAFTCLCLAMPRHYRQVWGDIRSGASRLRWLRVAGYAGLALAFAACVKASGCQHGPVQWMGMLVLGGISLVFLFAFKPRYALLLAAVAPACAGLLVLLRI